MSAIERVAAPCSLSQYKDERHRWEVVAGESSMYLRAHGHYEVRRCKECKLVIFLSTWSGNSSYPDHAPVKDDVIYHAFFEAGATT